MLARLWRILLIAWAVRTGWLTAGLVAGWPGIARHHAESAAFILAAVLLITLWWREVARPHQDDSLRVWRAADCVVIFAIAVALYWPAVSIGLLSDDFVLIDRAERGALADASWEMLRPAPLAVWALAFHGLPATWLPPALHLLNIGLHALNAVLVGALLRRAGYGLTASRLASCAFLVFPAAVEAVVWTSGIFDVMLTSLVLGAMYLVVAPGDTRWRMAAVVGIAGVALLTKETAIAFPVLILIAAHMRTQPVTPAAWRMAGASLLLVIAYAGWRVLRGTPANVFPPLDGYAVKELLTRPFGALVIPFHQSVIDGLPLVTALCAGAAPLAMAIGVARHRCAPSNLARLGVCAMLWILAAAAPVFTWFFVGTDLQGSRYVYLPAAGWALLIAAATAVGGGASWWLRTVGGSLAVVWIAICAVAVRHHLTHWTDAARVRDDVLAQELRRGTSCGKPPMATPPEHVAGAFVFKNGFAEALARACAAMRSE